MDEKYNYIVSSAATDIADILNWEDDEHAEMIYDKIFEMVERSILEEGVSMQEWFELNPSDKEMEMIIDRLGQARAEYNNKIKESKMNKTEFFNKIYESNFTEFSNKSKFKNELPASPGFPFEGQNTSTKSGKEMPAKIKGKPTFKYEKANDLLKARAKGEGDTYNARYAKTGSLTEDEIPTHTKSGKLIERKLNGVISPALKQSLDDFVSKKTLLENKIISKEDLDLLQEDENEGFECAECGEIGFNPDYCEHCGYDKLEDEVSDDEWDEYQDMDEEGEGLGTDIDDYEDEYDFLDDESPTVDMGQIDHDEFMSEFEDDDLDDEEF